jgi:hypothetical protein
MLLGLTGWGLEGWQWLFILEALPSVLVGIGVLIYLTDFPRQARWLQQDEITWLENVQAAEKLNKEKVEHLSLGQALTDPRIFLCALGAFLPRSTRGPALHGRRLSSAWRYTGYACSRSARGIIGTSRIGPTLPADCFNSSLPRSAQSSAQKSILWWTAKHRHHHLHSDTHRDVLRHGIKVSQHQLSGACSRM